MVLEESTLDDVKKCYTVTNDSVDWSFKNPFQTPWDMLTVVPDLIDEIERLRNEIARLHEHERVRERVRREIADAQRGDVLVGSGTPVESRQLTSTRSGWLGSTRTLQSEVYGYKFPLRDDDFAHFVTWNHTAAVKELGEALDEVGWKPWAGHVGWVNRNAFIGELVDAVHFIANLLVSVDCTDEEWEQRYADKQLINRKRQREGYDAVSTKCPACKRALDDHD